MAMKPSIGIYQPFYKPSLMERLDPGFIALDWLSNPDPALRELALHKHIADKTIYAKHHLTGLLSAKFFSKTKLKSQQVYNWILDNPNHDIYLVNGFPHVPYTGYNNIERAKVQRDYPFDISMRKLCRKIGLEIPEEFPRQTQANLCCCNFWIASATFWENWVSDVKGSKVGLLSSLRAVLFTDCNGRPEGTQGRSSMVYGKETVKQRPKIPCIHLECIEVEVGRIVSRPALALGPVSPTVSSSPADFRLPLSNGARRAVSQRNT